MTRKLKNVFGKAENILGKGENADYHHFLLFLKCFQMPSSSGLLKVGLCGKELMVFTSKPNFRHFADPTNQHKAKQSVQSIHLDLHHTSWQVLYAQLSFKIAAFGLNYCPTKIIRLHYWFCCEKLIVIGFSYLACFFTLYISITD